MPLVNLVIVLIVVGVLLWLVNTYITHGPKDQEHPEYHCRHMAASGLRSDWIAEHNTYRPMKDPGDNRLRADQVITNLFPGTDAKPRPNGLVEQAAYATHAIRFLATTRVYLTLQYTGSRHWYPNGGIFRRAICLKPSSCPAI